VKKDEIKRGVSVKYGFEVSLSVSDKGFSVFCENSPKIGR
jgi:hypothetical protein